LNPVILSDRTGPMFRMRTPRHRGCVRSCNTLHGDAVKMCPGRRGKRQPCGVYQVSVGERLLEDPVTLYLSYKNLAERDSGSGLLGTLGKQRPRINCQPSDLAVRVFHAWRARQDDRSCPKALGTLRRAPSERAGLPPTL